MKNNNYQQNPPEVTLNEPQQRLVGAMGVQKLYDNILEKIYERDQWGSEYHFRTNVSFAIDDILLSTLFTLSGVQSQDPTTKSLSYVGAAVTAGTAILSAYRAYQGYETKEQVQERSEAVTQKILQNSELAAIRGYGDIITEQKATAAEQKNSI